MTLQKDAFQYHYWYCNNLNHKYWYWYWYCKVKRNHFFKNCINKLVYSTNIEVDIDVEILQNLVILRRYCNCKSMTNCIVIDIAKFPRLLLILKLQTREHKYCYWYWYCKLRKTNIGIDIEVKFSLSHSPGSTYLIKEFQSALLFCLENQCFTFPKTLPKFEGSWWPHHWNYNDLWGVSIEA